ncbi:MAG TPA: SUMF1/EgtB/PvdO family nonheme iron enzyme [Sedimentisphaerales bacterium]|nr:SUMF1/EgtB/PvdO family nonheme iron enzyme [Sedimentisphaerales bacterium]
MKHSLNVTAILILLTAVAPAHAAQMPKERTFTNTVGIKLVRIEPGAFMMGQRQGGDFDEQPVHKVNITKPFYVAAAEVTNAQYEMFDPEHIKYRGSRGLSKNDNEAAGFISWNDAANFCRWLSKKEGKPYRLPTEAEWEYACRAGTTSPYYTGDELPEVYLKSQKRAEEPVPVDLTVARTPASRWGLCDMHGNVEEWCHDWYGPYAEGEQTDPVGRSDGDFKVTRSGSHNTDVEYLRSANRHGALPDDKHWLIGFRVVLGELPDTEPLPPPSQPELWAKDVKNQVHNWARGPDPAKPYFTGPQQYVKIPPNSNGPMFSRHNHDPALTWCDNGDLFAIWYSCNSERGRELCIVAARLRLGAEEWDDAAPFWDAPDRNDHAPAMLNDGQGTLYHFNGLSVAANYRKNLALIMRTSEDNGVTWFKARLISPVRGISNQPIASSLVTREGYLLFTSDWPWHKDGRGSAIWISPDRGQTWTTPPGRIAGIHAGVTQLENGRLIALGRHSDIDGRMPKSISDDMGRTWTCQPSGLQPIGGGQRLVLLRLREGPLFLASFAKDMTITDAAGQFRKVKGLYAALSFDQGETWPIRRLVNDGRTVSEAKAMDGRPFTMSPASAEPKGYMTGIQTPDGVIHLIGSWNHYAFNLAWLKTLMLAAETK